MQQGGLRDDKREKEREMYQEVVKQYACVRIGILSILFPYLPIVKF